MKQNLLTKASSNLSQRIVAPLFKPLAKEVKRELRRELRKQIQPVTQPKTAEPIVWDVPTSFNSTAGRQNRGEAHTQIGYDLLRRLATNYPIARACIDYRRAQLKKLEWDIISTKDEKKEATISAIHDFFLEPFGNSSSFPKFLDKLVGDILTIDALTLAKELNLRGDLLRLIPIDPATIRVRVDEQGLIPEPPEIAYEQYIDGRKHASFTTDELLYDFMNPSTYSPYGFSPIESLIVTVNTALRIDTYNFNTFQRGNVPEGLMTTPEGWDIEQIKQWQVIWDSMVNSTNRELKWVPEGTNYIPTKQGEMQFREFEQWLMQVTCAVFHVPPEEIGFTSTVNKATSETQKETVVDIGLAPLAIFFEEVFTRIIRQDFGESNLAFKFTDIDPTDSETELKHLELDLKMGLRSVDEVRRERGEEELGLGHFIMTAQGPILVEDLKNKEQKQQVQPNNNPVEVPEQKQKIDAKSPEDLRLEDLRKWRRRALADLKRGKLYLRAFDSQFIDEVTVEEIEDKLALCDATAASIAKVFDQYLTTPGQLLYQIKKIGQQLEETKTNIFGGN